MEHIDFATGKAITLGPLTGNTTVPFEDDPRVAGTAAWASSSDIEAQYEHDDAEDESDEEDEDEYEVAEDFDEEDDEDEEGEEDVDEEDEEDEEGAYDDEDEDEDEEVEDDVVAA